MSALRNVLAFVVLLATTASASLQSQLQSVVQFTTGLVHKSDAFRYKGIPCGYLEGENITCSDCSWGVGGSCPYMWGFNGSAPPPTCTPGAVTKGMDRPGGDYRTQALQTDDVSLCQSLCCAEEQCESWVYVPSAPSAFLQCTPGQHCCYLKGTTPSPSSSSLPGIQTGTAMWPAQNLTHPPLGMRSSVPLGGLGTGAFELRADGTFHEWTLINQHPAGAAKFGVVSDALIGLRVQSGAGSSASRLLRTAPPPGAVAAGVTGVDSIRYSGSYPVSRLDPSDAAFDSLGLEASLFAYSALTPGDAVRSGIPAVAFSLTLRNSGSAPLNVSLLLALPLAGFNDCSRAGAGAGSVVSLGTTASPADCLSACASASLSTCAAWTYKASTGECAAVSAVRHSVFEAGSYCGVRGSWRVNGGSGALTMATSPASGSPASGEACISPVDGEGVPTLSSTGLGGSVQDLLTAWNGGGGVFPPSASSSSSGPGGAATSTLSGPGGALIGGVSVSTRTPLAPGSSAVLSLVFAWWYPDRDHGTAVLGNHYATLYASAEEAANALGGSSASLANAVADVNAHHAVFAGPGSALPAWLQDAAINEMSHFRGMIWTGDGRMREYEANDCPDLDSIHNDYQRHLPYLWMFPEFERQKLVKWGSGQSGDGHIGEYLGSFDLGPFDEPGGRVMGDTTTLWITELWELYAQTGDVSLVAQLWPKIANAITWQIAVSSSFGLPLHLVCTYDILALEAYNTTTFNSGLHILSMRAGAALARVMGDNATATAADAAAARATIAVQALLWNSTYGYYRAYTSGDAIMSDALYGAKHHGFGWIFDKTQVLSHLDAETKYNGNPYGFTVLTGRHEPPPEAAPLDTSHGVSDEDSPLQQEPSSSSSARLSQLASLSASAASNAALLPPFNNPDVDTQDDVVWLGGGPTWSYLKAVSGTVPSLDDALAPARASTENFRTRLNDWWNLVGITTSASAGWAGNEGMPYITSHYGFLLPNLYLVYAVSGQVADIPQGSLSFAPLVPAGAPFSVPLLLPGTTGTVSCAVLGQGRYNYTVALAFGGLRLPGGGLSVNGAAYLAAVDLGPGGSVSWTGTAAA